MKKNQQQCRYLIAREAARLMYEEQVGEYFTAKKMAAKRLFGSSRQMAFNPKMLPSNGEIQQLLHGYADLHEGADRQYRLREMRQLALLLMQELAPFHPRLIGSVSTGQIRQGSDIDLHIFADSVEEVDLFLQQQGYEYELKQVDIQKNSSIQRYNHFYLSLAYPVELSLYPLVERRITTRSSTDGKPIKRLTCTDVQRLLEG